MYWFSVICVICSLISWCVGVHTVLNVDEINSVHYGIDILSKPIIKSKDEGWNGEMMTVVNRHGQEYLCSLPNVAPLDSDSKHDDDILDQLVDISVLLKPMETAPCLIKTVDWWTYEFCYGSVIKQYHLEDNKASGPIIILGKYESEYNWKNSSETKNRLQRFHSQFYVNGTKCDLTGEPRRTEVRFHCEDGVGDYIQRVDEPESCRYVVTVATTRVCHHPYLRLQAVRTPHTITCAPALTEEQYNKYLTYQEQKNQEEETLKKKWLKQNAEILREANSEEKQNILQPISTGDEEDDELKMNIKIFRLSPVKKHKNQQSSEVKDIMEVETQITLEESETGDVTKSLDNTQEDIDDVSSSDSVTKEEGKNADDLSETSSDDDDDDDEDDEEEEDEEEEDSLISDLKAQELLQLLDVTEDATQSDTEASSSTGDNLGVEQKVDESYMTEEDELDGVDDDDDESDIDESDSVRQASKSTKRDHFSKLQRRLKQLGKMFLNQEPDGTKEEGNNKITELQKVVDNIKDGHIKELEEEVKEWTKKLLSKNMLLELDEEELEQEEQRLGSALSSLMDALDDAENKLSTAKKEMKTLEEFLDNQLKEMEQSTSLESESSSSQESSQQDWVDKELQDPTEGMSQALQNSQDPIEGDSSSKLSKKKIADKESGSTRQLRIMKNRMEDESQKTKLEQTIKDRLQKLGLEKIGRKFEVKILTPNSLEDEDTNNPLLSQEETEAFQNMIVNLLSANAEELEERENHRRLEKNYGFSWDDSQIAEDEEE